MPCWSAVIKMMVLTLAKGLNCALHNRGSLDSETDPPGARKGGNSRKWSRWKCQGFRGIWQNELQDKEKILKFMWEIWTLRSQWEHWTQGIESEAGRSLQGLAHWLTECRAQFTDPAVGLTSLLTWQEGQSYLSPNSDPSWCLLVLSFSQQPLFMGSSPHFTSCLFESLSGPENTLDA